MGNSSSKKSSKEIINDKLNTSSKTGVLNLSNMKLKVTSKVWNEINARNLSSTLRNLDISQNSFKTVPEVISTLSSLKYLNISKCQLHNISIDLQPLQHLQVLDLSHNDIDIDGITYLPITIQKLNLSHNHFSAIPSILISLIQLTELDISYNRIENMYGIGQITSLIYLKLDYNMIMEVSLDCHLLIKLKHLSLQYNRIGKYANSYDGQSIPSLVFTETILDTVDLTGNPLTNGEIMNFQGVEEFLKRKKELKEKSLSGGALSDFSVFGLL